MRLTEIGGLALTRADADGPADTGADTGATLLCATATGATLLRDPTATGATLLRDQSHLESGKRYRSARVKCHSGVMSEPDAAAGYHGS